MTIISRLQALMLLLLLKCMCDYINIFISFSKGCDLMIWQCTIRYAIIFLLFINILFLFPKVPKVERSDDLTVYNPLRDQIFFIIEIICIWYIIIQFNEF